MFGTGKKRKFEAVVIPSSVNDNSLESKVAIPLYWVGKESFDSSKIEKKKYGNNLIGKKSLPIQGWN